MGTYSFDVVIVGAGPAGVAAAGALAGSGVSVALLEAGAYAGAENWSGCVYFAESLAEPDCFGPAAVQNAPFERQVVRRGTLVHNGVDEIGVALTDPAVFRHCYTVLRPVYDPYFASLAHSRGAVLLTETTVTSLIRTSGRVVGVNTERGPLHAGVVFLAEGDASHLVHSENLERVNEPHYLQGVKAVLSLPSAEVEKRFGLRQGEGAAFEILLRNGTIAGRTARLNVGGFVYTNRDSLSIGYVVPLENLRKSFRGDHSRLLEWMRGLPHLRELLTDAKLSAYGAKIIRSGGWRERPMLVEDGLAVGGAATGLGIDIPFPNFTGPASASGLYFARAVKRLLKDGRSLDAKNLTEAYLLPLQESVCGRNAQYLSGWSRYFSRSSVLFGRTADMLCGSARFLASGSTIETGRFLRTHILSLRALREFTSDKIAAITALRLWKPLLAALIHPATVGSWFMNVLRPTPQPDPRLSLIVNTGNGKPLPFAPSWPLGGFVRRISPALAKVVASVYANDAVPAEQKFSGALRTMLRSLSATDLVMFPLFGIVLVFASILSAAVDAFRYYVLRTPAEKFLAEPVMAYEEQQRKARDIDAVRPEENLEAKLGLNTYRVGSQAHIRTLWPEQFATHTEMAKTGLWWVCPARVYTYDAPLFGRGKATVNWENCIKCESCWRAEPSFALWGRFTDHRLVYRPASAAVAVLLEAQKRLSASASATLRPQVVDKKLWYPSPAVPAGVQKVLCAAASYRRAVYALPLSADKTRRTWPHLLGQRLCSAALELEQSLSEDGRRDPAHELRTERLSIEERLKEGRTFQVLYAVTRLEQLLAVWLPNLTTGGSTPASKQQPISSVEARQLFPDQAVKQWEEVPMPVEWEEKLRTFIGMHRHPSRRAVRALSSISPALGLVAACQLRALRAIRSTGRDALPGLCALDAGELSIRPAGNGATVEGTLGLVPMAAAKAFLLIAKDRGYIVARESPGVLIKPTPAIGFRAAALADVSFHCAIAAENIVPVTEATAHDATSYLAVALGAADYLSSRAQDHAVGRVQFAGQMLDTEGRDGIVKLGAVKAMLARVEAWRLLLETLFDAMLSRSHQETAASIGELGLLSASVAAIAFGPEHGSLAYDAGQVFGGFAYSEDDLLSRFYRDSSLFPFFPAGLGAARAINAAVAGKGLEHALGSMLDTLPSASGQPVDGLVKDWRNVTSDFASLPAGADVLLRGNAASVLLGVGALITKVNKALAAGASPEAEAAAVQVLIGLADDAVTKAALSAGRGTVDPDGVFPIAPSGAAVVLDLDYGSFCGFPGSPHRSGSFLVSVFDRSPRYVPEMQLHDPELRKLWQELTEWFLRNCREQTFDGLSFERHVEKLHDLPPSLIEAAKKHKWLATYIPRNLDGLGWRKAGYYILNSAAGSFGDAAVCLLIMASTSIGTTPILLGLKEELPRVRKELEPLTADEMRLGEIGSRISRLTASFRNPNPGWIRKEYGELMRLVDSRIRHTSVVKYLAANFLRSFYGAGLAGQRGDFGGFMQNLDRAARLFERLMPDVRSSLEELPRRERCHQFHLRTLGHGGVAAFALTEPTAGSDSGGVKTTAQLRSAALDPLPDGRFAFSPQEEKGRLRYLIDADRIVFTDEGMAYQLPDGTTASIRHDHLDPAVGGARHYTYQGMVCEFHDIAQVRRDATGLVYEYYSLTGAKMWITNGAIATQFSLFAQTQEGVTGFIVDRFAEGLKVGADERKTGQRGSPTNEISLDSVRVPREAVIGFEGHGQVNALETLNVGRCGLAVVAGSLARKILAAAREELSPSPERYRLLGEAAAIQFGSESLAYYLIGLFDRPHESVRMESAIAKFVCSEDIHEIISLVEQAYGPDGQTERHLVEKARRDARILNIYEGTNEVQRFLILKDLVAMAGDWPQLPAQTSGRPDDRRAMTLAAWKNSIREHVMAAAGRLGDNAWSDAMLQPAFFRLAEMAGEVLRLECIWYRTEWLDAHAALLGEQYVGPLLSAGERASVRALARLEYLDRRFRQDWERISSNLLAPEVHAADAILDRTVRGPEVSPPDVRLSRAPLRILAILRPVADLSPEPDLEGGWLREILWQTDPLDRPCIDQPLGMKESGADLAVDVLLAGGPERQDVLRKAGAGADSLMLLEQNNPDAAAMADVVRELERSGGYDLILCGEESTAGLSGLAPFLAGRLARPFASAQRLAVREDGSGFEGVPMPAVLSLTASSSAAERKISPLIDAAISPVIAVRAGAATQSRPPVYEKPAAAVVETKTITTVADAAGLLKDYAAVMNTAQAEIFSEAPERGTLPKDVSIWAVLDTPEANANVSALRAAKLAADLFGRKAAALIAAPRSEWPVLLGLVQANGIGRACCLNTKDRSLSLLGMRQVVAVLRGPDGTPAIFAGPRWNDALAFTAGAAQGHDIPYLLNAVSTTPNPDGRLDVRVPAYGGKLLQRVQLGDGALFVTFSSEAELGVPSPAAGLKATEVDMTLGLDMTIPLAPAVARTLVQAEVIIDLGYGIRDRTGLQLATELRKALESMGLAPLFGATRKVTQDLKLLPLETQIGQTGVRVNPKLIVALGISGAPQHVDWIGTRAEILCFNKDPEAPLMKLNESRPAPRVHPILGDLFVTIPELIRQLGRSDPHDPSGLRRVP